MTDWWDFLDPFATPLRTYAVSVVVALISGLVPVINIEAYLVTVALLAPDAGWPMVPIAVLGQLVAKYILYVAGRDGVRPRAGRYAARLERVGDQLREHRLGTFSVVAMSAFLGLPPLYAVTIMAGVLRLPLTRFMLVTGACRIVRFALVFYAARYFTWPPW